jgi:hypothetical protein
MYDNFNEMIREFVKNRPSITYIEVQLEGTDTGQKLEDATGIDRNCWKLCKPQERFCQDTNSDTTDQNNNNNNNDKEVAQQQQQSRKNRVIMKKQKQKSHSIMNKHQRPKEITNVNDFEQEVADVVEESTTEANDDGNQAEDGGGGDDDKEQEEDGANE